jgi:large repetitive protein
MSGKWLAAGAAFFLFAAACAPPKNTIALISPTPSPSPTPTTPLAMTGPTFHIGEVGVAYAAVSYTASGGVQPYHWAVSGGALPGGLTLGSDGSISGMPTTSGDFSFRVGVADSGDSNQSAAGKISIAARLAASLIPACAKYCNVELGCVNVCGNFGTVSGGVGPYNTNMTQGPLPAGTSLSGLSLAGTFGGGSGYLQFTIQVTDAVGAATTIAPTFWMYPHISLTGGTIPASPQTNCSWLGAGPNDPGCTATFPYTGGTPNSGTVIAGASWASYSCPSAPCSGPPPMPTITIGSGMITVSVPRGYANTSGYKGTLTITLTNQDLCAAGPAKCSSSANVTITQASG